MVEMLHQLMLIAVIYLSAAWTGRSVALLFNIKLLLKASTESLLAAAFLGNGIQILLYGMGMYFGLNGNQSTLAVLMFLIVTTMELIRRRKFSYALAVKIHPWFFFIHIILLTHCVLVLLPIGMGECFLYFTDSMIYTSGADWLSAHGIGLAHAMGSPLPSTDSLPLQQLHAGQPLIAGLLAINHRMGSFFLLSIVQTVFDEPLSVLIYPAVSAWGCFLNIAGIVVISRWTLRTSRFATGIGVGIIATFFPNLSFAANHGFFSQVFGTACLAFFIAFVSRVFAFSNWTRGNAVLLGVAIAIQLTHYPEMVPVSVFLLSLCVVGQFFRARRQGRIREFFRFNVSIAVSTALVANIECFRAVQSILYMVRASLGLPWPWSDWRRLMFAIGGWNPFQPVSMYARYATIAASLFMLVLLITGLCSLILTKRSLPIWGALLVLGGLIIFYRFFSHDPWLNITGHSYRLTKVCMWSFPVFATIQIGGLAWFVKWVPRRWIIIPLLAAFVGLVAVPSQVAVAEGIVDWVRREYKTQACRLADIRLFRNEVLARNPHSVYVLLDPTPSFNPWLQSCPGNFLSPLPFMMPDNDSHSVPQPPNNTVCLQFGRPPNEPPLQGLPFGHYIVDGSHPFIYKMLGPSTGQVIDLSQRALSENESVSLYVYSPQAGQCSLTFDVTFKTVCEPEVTRWLQITSADGTVCQRSIVGETQSQIQLPLKVSQGTSQVQLNCFIETSGRQISERGVMPIVLKSARIDFADAHNPTGTVAGRSKYRSLVQ